MASTDLAGAAALVTGATSGIGRPAARSLARRGAHVLVRLQQGSADPAHQGVGSGVRAERVRVNAVSPGPTRTEGTEVMGDQLDQLAALAPAGRPAAPEEIAAAITYLASDGAL
ncbi:MAG TPA: SDR family oxidoreductase [Streptosporangiaceae bacterium]|nr:SDR family oxidoreductase [Streptosporangiaceae bacterium]